MAQLDARTRQRLPDTAFAYIDSRCVRRLPINDVSHVRNALARFDQVTFENETARERARDRLLRAAKKHGIVPLGFFDGQLRKERRQLETKASASALRKWPRGTVTFLLSDIEGSTALLQRLGHSYASLLRDIRSMIRASVRAADGHEVDARADEFFAVFRHAGRALEAAVEIQRSLADRGWPRGVAVRVRMGIHAGRPSLTDAGYVGIAVHTAARICNAAHGGQVLVSSAAREALGAGAIAGITFRSLGEYALPSLSEPMALFQVRASGLRTDFPGLRVRAD